MVSGLQVEYSIHPTLAILTLVRELKQWSFDENQIFYISISVIKPSTHHLPDTHKDEGG